MSRLDSARLPAAIEAGQRRRRLHAIDALLLASVALPAFVFGAGAAYDRHQTIAAAKHDLLSTVDTLHGHAENVFRFEALALGATDAWLSGLSNEQVREGSEAHHAHLRALRRHTGDTLGIVVFGADGRPIVDFRPGGQPAQHRCQRPRVLPPASRQPGSGPVCRRPGPQPGDRPAGLFPHHPSLGGGWHIPRGDRGRGPAEHLHRLLGPRGARPHGGGLPRPGRWRDPRAASLGGPGGARHDAAGFAADGCDQVGRRARRGPRHVAYRQRHPPFRRPPARPRPRLHRPWRASGHGAGPLARAAAVLWRLRPGGCRGAVLPRHPCQAPDPGVARAEREPGAAGAGTDGRDPGQRGQAAAAGARGGPPGQERARRGAGDAAADPEGRGRAGLQAGGGGAGGGAGAGADAAGRGPLARAPTSAPCCGRELAPFVAAEGDTAGPRAELQGPPVAAAARRGAAAGDGGCTSWRRMR